MTIVRARTRLGAIVHEHLVEGTLLETNVGQHEVTLVIDPPAPPPGGGDPVDPPPGEDDPVDPPPGEGDPVDPPPEGGGDPVDPPVPPGDVDQFLTTDAGEGPTRERWSTSLLIPWRNYMGDWLDASSVPQGPMPFAQAEVTALGQIAIPLGDAQAFRRGVFLVYGGKSSPSATIAGRLSETPPVLRVTLADGSSADLPCRCMAAWSPSTSKAMDTRQAARITATDNGLAHFIIPPDAFDATLVLNVIAKGTPNGVISAFAANPPGISYPWLAEPTLGLAAEVAESALADHPDVLRAGDFSPESMAVMFDELTISENADPQYIVEVDGRTTFRGRFRDRAELAAASGNGLAWADQNGRGSFGALVQLTKPDMADPLRPALPGHEEMFARLYFKMDDDWLASNDGNKMAIGWDLRLGIWMDSGYWQQTTGNGGARGTGLKVLAPAGRVNGQKEPRWEYQGHSIRMEAGVAPADPADPYRHLRPVNSYVYHNDQYDFNGTIERWGNAVIKRGRWHCIEQQLKLNSVVGPFDANGNGQAVADGVLRTWVDGVLVGERTGMRWRRHPEISIEGPWLNWFFGGKQAADREMHYEMKDLVVAKRYVGPRTA